MKNLAIMITTVLFFTVLLTANAQDKYVNVKATKMDMGKDIVTTAIEAGNFKTLATALTEAGLVETLKGTGPFTVFAPTDDAFAKLPKGALEGLLKDKEALKKVLLYHVVSGTVTSSDVVKLNEAVTVEGSKIKIKTDDGKVMINNANVVKADIKASNGVIHVIDTVILPPTE